MNVGLFVPCYIEQYYPQVAIAALDLLERNGCRVEIPDGQTCCGQPLANVGNEAATVDVATRFADLFERFDYIVTPSGSCALHVRDHYGHLTEDRPAILDRIENIQLKTYELCQFLFDVLGVRNTNVRLARRVGIHQGCHGLRGLRLGNASELMTERRDVVRTLLESVEDIQMVELDRVDECCGFGGTFSVSEEAVSVKMGKDRLADHMGAGAEIIVSADMSCLMHLQGVASRQGTPVEFYHVAEILNGSAS